MEREIRIRVRRANQDEDEIIQLCRGMRLLSERDIDATLAILMRHVMELGNEKEIGCSELARVSGLNRITCIHHMKRLEKAGIVEKDDTKYKLVFDNFEGMVEGMRKRMLSDMAEFERMAREIDSDLELSEIEERKIETAKPTHKKRVKIEID